MNRCNIYNKIHILCETFIDPKLIVVFQSTLSCDILPDVPVAVLFNKTDRKEAVGEEFLVETLGISTCKTGKVLTKIYT